MTRESIKASIYKGNINLRAGRTRKDYKKRGQEFMAKEMFVGIDVSKEMLDVAITIDWQTS